MDLLLPRTDAGVAVQLVAVLTIGAASVWGLRRRPELRLVAIGLLLIAVGLIGVRALH